MKTIEQRIEEVIAKASSNDNNIFDNDTIERLILSAYYMGYERAVKETSDRYNKVLKEQLERVEKEHYHNVAMRVQGGIEYLYSPDYREPTRNELIADLTTNL